VRAEHLIFAMRPDAGGGIRSGQHANGQPGPPVPAAPAKTDRRAISDAARRTRGQARLYGGLALLQVAVPGAYRISADQPLWIDVAFNGALLKPQDFQGRRGCNAPHKIVEFQLPMGVQLTLQISNAAERGRQDRDHARHPTGRIDAATGQLLDRAEEIALADSTPLWRSSA
jgi:hypothetical protein